MKKNVSKLSLLKGRYSTNVTFIPELLRQLGISYHLVGYYYLLDTLIYVSELPVPCKENFKFSKNMYLYLAQKHNSTPSIVERELDYIVNVSFSYGNVEILKELFDFYTPFNITDITFYEFIFSLVKVLIKV